MLTFYHLIDVLPFAIASLIVLFGPMRLSMKRPITIFILITTAVYILAQSAWFSSYLGGNEWGRAFSNYIWFFFNTSTMVIFAITLYKSSE